MAVLNRGRSIRDGVGPQCVRHEFRLKRHVATSVETE